MKKFWSALGTIALGIILLTGCGDEPTGVTLNGKPIDPGGIGTENQGQSGQEQNDQGQKNLEPGGERIALTMGVLGYSDSPMMQQLVEAYNARSEKYYVEMVEYQPEYADYEASKDRFRMELATGKGTDIILFGGMIADELGHGGVLLDLNTLLTPEDKQEKYLGNILECAQTGNALYEISPAFTLEFIVGDGSKIGMEPGWTMEEMLAGFEKNGRDGLALAKGQGRTVERLVESSMDDYVDWDMGTANFCKEEFYRVLEFGKNIDKSEYIRPTRESVASGTHLASCEMLTNVADIQYFRWLFGDNAAVKGYPCSHGTGVAVSTEQNSMGICSYSRCPEGAWDFLEFYVGATWAEREFYEEGILVKEDYFSSRFAGLPVSRQLFEEKLTQSMEQKYFADGKPVPLLQGEGGRPDFYANTAEDVEKLRELIALADRRYFSDRLVICQIIEEEISGYNLGVLTAEQTAEKIQNRVQVYLNEQK